MLQLSKLGLYTTSRRVFFGMFLVLVANLTPVARAASINILPIRVCDDAGLMCGNDAGELFLAETNKIWAQAGLTFNYLPFTSINSTAFLNLDDQAEVDLFFNTAPGGAANPLTISMWFVGSIFDAFGEANAIPGNKVVIDQLVFTVGRLDTIAHEVGHLLGLQHDDPGVETDFLMRSGDDRITPTTIDDITPDGAALDKLTAAQIATALADPKVLTAVPEPATFATMLCGLGVLGLVFRRRKASRV
ncbi:MAG: PEP-CTERM sorting domain-containing protein [Bryobacteraceae bacterium]|nr:PEP-CTERM sorting domain-containing protein [Bryobacteraceae bacterium]